jgi:CheY-like chemotaxis protein
MYGSINNLIGIVKCARLLIGSSEYIRFLFHMNPNNPIIVIDDDPDDHELFNDACRELKIPNKIIGIESGRDFLRYLDNTPDPPFLIISDFNLPGMNGLKLRKTVMQDPYLRYKSVPYLIWTTGPNEIQIRDAYEHMVQGFFIKPNKFEELVRCLRTIIEYWQISLHPSKT